MKDSELSFRNFLIWVWVIICFGVGFYIFIWGGNWVGRVVIFAFVPDSYDSLSSGFVKLWGDFWHWAAKFIAIIGGIGLAVGAFKVMISVGDAIGVSIGLIEPESSEESENTSNEQH